MTAGYSSRFSFSQPPSMRNRAEEHDEIERQTREFLASGGTIKQITGGTPAQFADPITGHPPEQRQGAAKKAAKKRWADQVRESKFA